MALVNVRLCEVELYISFQNADRVVKSGMGLKLDIRYIKKEELKSTLIELLTNKVFTEKAQLMSWNFRDQPETPMERALWWIAYVLRNPDVSFLQSKPLKEMNYILKHSIDVIAFLTVVLLLILILIVKLSICLLRKKNPQEKRKLQ